MSVLSNVSVLKKRSRVQEVLTKRVANQVNSTKPVQEEKASEEKGQ